MPNDTGANWEGRYTCIVFYCSAVGSRSSGADSPTPIFDAGENTVDWSVEASGSTVVAIVRTAVVGPDLATGIEVRLRCATVEGTGALDASGRATIPLKDRQGDALTESAAWDHDWSATSVVVGADTAEAPEIRERVRQWARSRLELPPRDAFLAEILASESAY